MERFRREKIDILKDCIMAKKGDIIPCLYGVRSALTGELCELNRVVDVPLSIEKVGKNSFKFKGIIIFGGLSLIETICEDRKLKFFYRYFYPFGIEFWKFSIQDIRDILCVMENYFTCYTKSVFTFLSFDKATAEEVCAEQRKLYDFLMLEKKVKSVKESLSTIDKDEETLEKLKQELSIKSEKELGLKFDPKNYDKIKKYLK